MFSELKDVYTIHMFSKVKGYIHYASLKLKDVYTVISLHELLLPPFV